MNVLILCVPIFGDTTGETTTRLPAAKSPSSVEILFANPNGHGTYSPNGTRFTLSYRLTGSPSGDTNTAEFNGAPPAVCATMPNITCACEICTCSPNGPGFTLSYRLTGSPSGDTNPAEFNGAPPAVCATMPNSTCACAARARLST